MSVTEALMAMLIYSTSMSNAGNTPKDTEKFIAEKNWPNETVRILADIMVKAKDDARCLILSIMDDGEIKEQYVKELSAILISEYQNSKKPGSEVFHEPSKDEFRRTFVAFIVMIDIRILSLSGPPSQDALIGAVTESLNLSSANRNDKLMVLWALKNHWDEYEVISGMIAKLELLVHDYDLSTEATQAFDEQIDDRLEQLYNKYCSRN